jgi:hypothetical protein
LIQNTKKRISQKRETLDSSGAEGRTRTDMVSRTGWILSPVRLPISPLRHLLLLYYISIFNLINQEQVFKISEFQIQFF